MWGRGARWLLMSWVCSGLSGPDTSLSLQSGQEAVLTLSRKCCILDEA